MKIFWILLGISFMAHGKFSVFHYNIKELDSSKLTANHPQIKALKPLFIPADIISINEIQYDLPGVPNQSFLTKAQNITRLQQLLGLQDYVDQSFHPANTGLSARKKADGQYYTDAADPQARAHADPINFGLFPAQYSTAGIFKHKKIKEIVITDLLWKDFNPAIDFSKYKLANGASIPEDIPLFDKNFSDITLRIEGKDLHVILLHTTPSYHFGNPHSINDLRNAEQLRFLQWYLTGKTDYPIKLDKIKPLPADAYYLAIGDFNVSIFDKTSEGQSVLLKLMQQARSWVEPSKLSFTNESSHFAPNPMRLLLDYILVGPNIKILKSSILHPEFKREELGCSNKKDLDRIRTYRVDDKTCQVRLGEQYDRFKTASDHYPLYGEFEFK